MNKGYIKAVRSYIVDLDNYFINLEKSNFLLKLNNDIIPNLQKLSLRLKQFNLEKELIFNSLVIDCIESIHDNHSTQHNYVESIIDIISNLYQSVVNVETKEVNKECL